MLLEGAELSGTASPFSSKGKKKRDWHMTTRDHCSRLRKGPTEEVLERQAEKGNRPGASRKRGVSNHTRGASWTERAKGPRGSSSDSVRKGGKEFDPSCLNLGKFRRITATLFGGVPSSLWGKGKASGGGGCPASRENVRSGAVQSTEVSVTIEVPTLEAGPKKTARLGKGP